MMTLLNFVIEYYADRYDRSAFSCGDADLDGLLRDRAAEDIGCRACSVFAAIPEGTSRIAGYYTLTSASILRSSLAMAD